MRDIPCTKQLWQALHATGLVEQNEYCAQIASMLRQGMVSEGMAKTILFGLDPQIEKAIDFPCVLHRLPEAEEFYADGYPDFTLGTLDNDLVFGVRLLDRSRSIIAVGVTGSGKTMLLLVLLIAIQAHNERHPDQAISCIVFERKGRVFSRLAQRFGWKLVSIHHGLRLSQGPAEGMPANIWNNIHTEWFASRNGLVSSAGCYSAIVDLILPVLNPRPTQRPLWPTPHQCLDVARSIPPKLVASKPHYLDTLIQALDTTIRASGTLLDANDALDLERDVIAHGDSIVIDITNARPAFLRHYIVDLLVGKLLHGRMHRGDTAAPRVLVVLDEADEDLTLQAEADYRGRSLSPISQTLKQGREFNISCAIGLSHLGEMSRFVLSNATYQFFFSAADHKSLSDASNTLLLPYDGGQQTLRSLKTAEVIFVESLGAWPHAVRGTIKNVQLPT